MKCECVKRVDNLMRPCAACRKQAEPEPTTRQLEALNNPDNGPSDASYRTAMKDAGRGRMLS